VVTNVFTMNLGIKPADVFQDDDLFYSALNSLAGASGHPRTLGKHGRLLAGRLPAITPTSILEKRHHSFDSRGRLGRRHEGKLYHFEVMNQHLL